MASNCGLVSLSHILVLSLALNLGLLLCYFQETEKLGLLNGLTWRRAPRFTSSASSSPAPEEEQDYQDRAISLEQGDPAMYEEFWKQVGDKATIVIPGWQSMSYFSDIDNVCWFLEPELAKQVVRLHRIVGNAITDNRYIVVGTGSTQLFQALLYALVPRDTVDPVDVVSAIPYYSSYRAITECLKSGLYKWAGNAETYDKQGSFIEFVISPNNPDGSIRQSVVNRSGGTVIYDLAYYWPQYTPITSPADHDFMLFTLSKSTGHAGTRVGWALVKDKEVAEKMVDFIVLTSLGVSRDSQLRAARILKVAADSSEPSGNFRESLFEFGTKRMTKRWKLLREAAQQSGLFSVPTFSPSFCNFLNRSFEPHPAFAWLKCEGAIENCEGLLRDMKVRTRSGTHFGVSPRYARVSMIDREENMDILMKRLSMAKCPFQYKADER